MAVLCWSGSGVTPIGNTAVAYTIGQRVVPAVADTAANYLIGRTFVWECTTAGTTAAAYPTWPASAVAGTTTITSGTAVFTARNSGYSAGDVEDWTFATPYYLYAQYLAENEGDPTGGPTIFVHYAHQEELAADATFTYAAVGNSKLTYSVDKDNSNAYRPMGIDGWIGNSTANRSITIAGAGYVTMYGITLRVSGGTADSITLSGTTTNSHYVFKECYLWLANTTTTALIALGGIGENNGYVLLEDCTFRFNNVAQSIQLGDARVDIIGGSVSPEGKIPTVLFSLAEQGPDTVIEGMDLSACSTGKTLVGNSSAGAHTVIFSNCELGANVTRLATQTVTNLSSGVVYLYNCSTRGAYFGFEHYNALGSTVAQTQVTTSNGAKYDGVLPVAWKVSATSAADFTRPYVSPWIDVYYDTLGSISPYLEILVTSPSGGLSLPYDDLIWSEWSYLGTVESPRSTVISTSMALFASPAQLPTGMGLTYWNGNYNSNVYSFSRKLGPASAIAPKTIGHIRARVCVAYNTSTYSESIFVDPYIRGLTA